MYHNGPYVPPEEDIKIQVKVKNKVYKLDSLAAEMAKTWAAKLKTDYVKDKVFQQNFWKDFSKQLPDKLKNTVWPDDWDFTEAYKEIEALKEAKKNRIKKEKEQEKKEKEARKEKYGYAIIDGTKVEIMNYVVEPPGLFMGRGQHPLRGRWKPRITHEDIILNLSEDAPIPEGNWKAIVHNHNAIWIAFWQDKLTGNYKYVMPSPKSFIRQKNDVEKFEKATRLMDKMPEVISHINKMMQSKDPITKETATVLSIIAHLGIRVGDEKDEDEAETYGATTLLAKHIKIERDYVFFNFVGKDSVLYRNKVKLPDLTIKNLKEILRNKKPDEQVFQNVNSKKANEMLSKILPGATTKVFRTAIATAVMKNYLDKHRNKNLSELEKIKIFKEANILVAEKLNHRKTPTESAKQSIKKKKMKLKDLKFQLKLLKQESKEEISKCKNLIKTASTPLRKESAKRKLERTKEKYNKKVNKLEERIQKLTLQIDIQSKSLDLNLGTSLTAYVNPKITFGWAKEVELELEKIYTKANIEKFKWAKNDKKRH